MLRLIPDQGVLHIADIFRAVAEELSARSEPNMSIAAVVNAAFSLELFLKSLNMEWVIGDIDQTPVGNKPFIHRNVRKRGHSPSELYTKLDDHIRLFIEDRFTSSHLSQQSHSFTERLAEFDRVFEEWRYVFEGSAKSINLSRLIAILQFLSETLHAMRVNRP